MSELTEKLETLNQHEVATLYKTVFNSMDGQLVFEDLKNRCYAKTSTFGKDNDMTNRNEGMRSVILHIDTQLNDKPDVEKNEQEE